MISRTITAILSVGLASLGVAQPFSYAQKIVPIRAGVLLIESQRTPLPSSVPLNPAPHVWGNLELDINAKPATWTFFNPRGAGVLSVAQQARWATLVGAANVPAAGSRLSKKEAPYWEVSLANSTDKVLANYDVLCLPLSNGLVLNPLERERVREYIDQGGILWIDLQPRPTLLIDIFNPLPIPFQLNRFGGGNLTFNPSHPLMSYPNPVTIDDLSILQGGGTDVVTAVDAASIGVLGPIQSWISPDSFRIDPVAGDATGATVAVASIGEGFIVITTRGVSSVLNRGYANGAVNANITYTSTGPVNDGAQTAAAKIIINAVSLASGYPANARGSRHTGSSPIDIPAPLMRRFGVQSPDGSPMTLRSGAPPTVYKGRTIVVNGNRLMVFDSTPKTDLDNDGNPDDGLPDPPGYAGDLIWESGQVLPTASSVTCVAVPNSQVTNPNRGNQQVVDYLMLTDGQGNVEVYDLDSPASANVAPIAVIAPPDRARADSNGPYAPTVHEGVAFVADVRDTDGTGRVWVIDLPTLSMITTSGPWNMYGSARLAEPSASPTVGYIPIKDNSGGLDRVVYVPMKSNTASDPGADKPAGFVSIWFGARGERPAGVQRAGAQLRVTTRASLQNLPIYLPATRSHLGVKVSVIDSSGNPYTQAQLNGVFTGTISNAGQNGEFFLGLTGTGAALNWDGVNPDVTLRVDYTVDWGQTAPGPTITPSEAYIRGNLELPDDLNNARRILGHIALAANGNLFIATGKTPRGGTLFAIREDGRGEFNMLYRWDLYDRLDIRLNRSSPTQDSVIYPEAILDEDYLRQIVPFPPLQAPISNLYFLDGPTVLGDNVYIVARGAKSGFVPISTLLCFNSDPKPIELEIDSLPTGFSITQPDVARSADSPTGTPPTITPSSYSTIPAGQFTYEVDPTTLKGRIRLESVMTVKRGRVRDSLSSSLPLILTRGGSTDIIVEPELSVSADGFAAGGARGRWSPLRWYSVFNGYTVTGQPLVTGDTLYLSGSSVLPSIITGAGFAPRGLLYGMDSNISPTDASIKSNSVRPWMLQLNQLLPSGSPPGFIATPTVRWPQSKGVQSFFDWRVRLLQTAIPDSGALGVVGGDGTLVSFSNSRLYGFSRMDFYVADEGRVGRYDPSGNPIWTTDGTVTSGISVPTSVAGSGLPLSRPTRVYPGGENAYWIVDTGNDRIVRIDAGGRELRTLNEFKVDPVNRVSGMLDNEPTNLRLPKDVLIYTTIRPDNGPFSPAIGAGANEDELWVHYLIADSGRFRIVELIDRYRIDATTRRILGVVEYNAGSASTKPGGIERALGVLSWHSPSDISGKQYAYNSIDRVYIPDGSGGVKPVLAFGFGNFEPGRAGFGLDTTFQQADMSSGFGGIVIYDPLYSSTNVITQIEIPAIAQNIFWNESNASFTAPARTQRVQKINGLSSVTLGYVDTNNGPQLSVLYTDNYGAYEVIPGTTPAGPWQVRWMLPAECFKVMKRDQFNNPNGSNPIDARLTYARRLDSGEVMVVNGYYGRRRNPAFTNPYRGEVALIDGTFGGGPNEPGYDLNKVNLGFNSLSIVAELPPINGARTLSVPVFADRR